MPDQSMTVQSEIPVEADAEQTNDSVNASSNRREFLARASLLGFAIPGASVSLLACSGESGTRDASQRDTTRAAASESLPANAHSNSSSRLDSAVLKDVKHGATTASAPISQAASSATLRRVAPELPPLPAERIQKVHWHAKHVPIRITNDTVVAAWTFEGDIPGPVLHTRVGDTVEFTLTNDEDVPHSMDFHAAQVDPRVAFKSVGKGQSVTFSFTPKYAGAFMYHCGTAPVLMHIGSGMHGAIIVSPAQPLPPAKEFVIVQTELHLAPQANGVRAFDYNKMLSTFPDYVVFNGRPDQYMNDPIRVKLGDRVRFWMVNAGPTHPSNFHVVGEQFDKVYLGAPPASAIPGVQTWAVAPGGGMVFEMQCDVKGEFPFVNHGFGHGQKGGMGILVVE